MIITLYLTQDLLKKPYLTRCPGAFLLFFFFNCILGLGLHVKNCKIVAYVHTWLCGLLPPCPRHLYLAFLPMLSLPNLPTHPHCPSLVPDNRPQCVMLPSLCPCVLIVQRLSMSENMCCLIFCSRVSLPRMMVSRFIHVPTNDTNSSFLIAA